jgi:hypothetical protein
MFEHFFFLTAPEIKTGTDPGKKPPNSHCLPVVWRFCLCQVRMKGLEPPRLSAPDPKSGAATNYATSAKIQAQRYLKIFTNKKYALNFFFVNHTGSLFLTFTSQI